MASPLRILLIMLTTWLSSSSIQTSAYQQHEIETTERSVGQRVLLFSFKETQHGSNLTFQCSPSGPCVPCLYSEKSDDKYRCGEAGYRIPLKCLETEGGSKDKSEQKTQRSLLDDSSASKGKSQAYITYRSCIPAVNEEKLSVLGFEGILLCLLLISGASVYVRRKRSVAMPGVGAGRIPANSRF